jgi:hypothetical protein
VYLQSTEHARQAHQCITSTTNSPGSSSDVIYGKHPLITYYIGERHELVTMLSKWTIAIAATYKLNSNITEILNAMYKKDKKKITVFILNS